MPRYLPGTLIVDQRFFWIPVLPLPNHPGYHVGIQSGQNYDDIDTASGDARWRTLVVEA